MDSGNCEGLAGLETVEYDGYGGEADILCHGQAESRGSNHLCDSIWLVEVRINKGATGTLHAIMELSTCAPPTILEETIEIN